MNKKQKGKHGESIAALALEKAGYHIIERNWRSSQGELDIVARHRDEIVFVEVRANANGIDTALESIVGKKQKTLMRLAYAYLASHGLSEAAFRIDVVAVDLATATPIVEIIENAVGW